MTKRTKKIIWRSQEEMTQVKDFPCMWLMPAHSATPTMVLQALSGATPVHQQSSYQNVHRIKSNQSDKILKGRLWNGGKHSKTCINHRTLQKYLQRLLSSNEAPYFTFNGYLSLFIFFATHWKCLGNTSVSNKVNTLTAKQYIRSPFSILHPGKGVCSKMNLQSNVASEWTKITERDRQRQYLSSLTSLLQVKKYWCKKTKDFKTGCKFLKGQTSVCIACKQNRPHSHRILHLVKGFCFGILKFQIFNKELYDLNFSLGPTNSGLIFLLLFFFLQLFVWKTHPAMLIGNLSTQETVECQGSNLSPWHAEHALISLSHLRRPFIFYFALCVFKVFIRLEFFFCL